MILDDAKKLKEKDPQQAGKSIELLPDQMRQVLKDSRLIKIPREYSQIKHVVVNGMGGSNLGARLLRSMFRDELKVPLLIEPGYSVPKYVGKETLYLISSYSGTTEEPLAAYKEAKKRGAKILAITSKGNGKLEKMMLQHDIPGYIFKPELNPSGQPRMGIGYSVFGIATLLAKAGIFKIDIKEMNEIIAKMEIRTRKLKVESKVNLNPAKKIAISCDGKIIIFVGAEHTSDNVHIIRNHFNENSKYFSAYLTIPELNHYAMEGLSNPQNKIKNLAFVFFESDLYHPRIQKRIKLTKQVVKKNGVKVIDIKLKGSTKREQGFEMLQLGEWASYYLGMMYGVDPVKIPWVDWFKEQLK